MSISIDQIKELRDATGVSMTACKKALEEAAGDYEKAVELLRKRGEAKAADRAARETANGVVVVKSDAGKAAIVSLQCETDFVARGDEFVAFANELAEKVLAGEIDASAPDSVDLVDAGTRLGENIKIGDMALVEGEILGDYIHSNGKIGVVVAMDGANAEVARDVAMHAAATNPAVLSPEEISDDLVAKEKGIWTDQLKAEGKPEEIIEKIMIGKEKKFREESALLKQAFVKNPDQSVEEMVAAAGGTIKSFTRFAI